jgi:peroxiredoxin Q/BCP
MSTSSSPSMQGKKAPDFELEDKDSTSYSLKSFKGDGVVLFFYPRDNTPGCTIESKEFTAALKQFERLGVAVVGVSGGDAETNKKFCKKNKLTVTLLSDPEFKTADAYGVYGEKQFMGRKFMGIHRRTFVINKKGIIEKVFEKVTPEGHAAEVIEYLKGR